MLVKGEIKDAQFLKGEKGKFKGTQTTLIKIFAICRATCNH